VGGRPEHTSKFCQSNATQSSASISQSVAFILNLQQLNILGMSMLTQNATIGKGKVADSGNAEWLWMAST